MSVVRIGVVGAGTMGAGIAQVAALGGYETLLHDPVPEALEGGLAALAENLARGAEKGLWEDEAGKLAGERVAAAPSLGDLTGCDLVVEAAPEDLELKRELFAALAAACGPEAVLATNTSSLPVGEIAAAIPHPERVVGMHFFNPPALMELVEVVAAEGSAPAAVETAVEVGRRMGRTPIRAKDSPGFVANRLARPFTLEPLRMLAEGVAEAEAIDRIVRLGGGFRMGPFELIDLIGLDVNLGVARSFHRQGGEPERWRPSEIQATLVAEGRLGRKSGRGFYEYGEGRRREPDPELGIEAPTLDPDELARIDPAAPAVLPRLLAQIANEAAFAREEEIASPGDMDTAMRLGFNWPRGPLELTALIGPGRARALLEELRERHGEAYRPAPLLRDDAARPGLAAPAEGETAPGATVEAGDFEEARRGLVAPFDPPVVTDERGRTVWDLRPYEFLEGEVPPTAHPNLWRQAQLGRIAGLFELAPGLYQLRGFDLSNMHVIEGEEGIVVVDPLISSECAAAALALYREHRGERPVTGLLYTHSHVDHFGGARGVVDPDDVAAGRVPALAPAGFLQHAVSENVFAGIAMGRRAGYMFGAPLGPGPAGQLGAGLGQTNSTGTISLVPPTLEVGATGQEETVDGIRFRFQLTPGTEAPAEMNFHLPALDALCIADNAVHSMHNVLTPRGALVRDPRIWAHHLEEAIELFGASSEVLFAGHHWPCWGRERIVEFLEKQRDLYAYLHDQTLRLLNAGHTGMEIAELVELPPSLAEEWHCREFYGSVSHNVKAIYQRYMGWFDGNPAHLWQHPPVAAAKRYVEFMGGADAVLEKARESLDAGDLRWTAEVVDHVVFAEPENAAARELQAEALERLGHGAENATWRNFYLMGAKELREGVGRAGGVSAPPDVVANLSVSQLLDAMAIRLDGPRAWDAHLRIDWAISDPDETRAVTVRRGVLRHRPGPHDPAADAALHVDRKGLDRLLLDREAIAELAESGRLRVEGDGTKLGELLGLLDEPDPGFPIVTP